jgi:hypothetical protein
MVPVLLHGHFKNFAGGLDNRFRDRNSIITLRDLIP